MARRPNMTPYEVIRVATRMFMERGYTKTSIKAIGEALNMSTGHVMFYFPSKEHMLAVLVRELCNFQWELMRKQTEEGTTAVMAICLELMTMAAACEESEVAKDFFISSYTHPMTLEIIRKSDEERAKIVFAEYCPDWTDEQFREAETLVSGIEYASLMTTADSAPLETRILGALRHILTIYQVPEEIRIIKLEKVKTMDYRRNGKHILEEFINYIEHTNEQALEELLK